MRNKVHHVIIFNVIYQIETDGEWIDGIRVGEYDKSGKYIFLDTDFNPVSNIVNWKERGDFFAIGNFEPYKDESITRSNSFGK